MTAPSDRLIGRIRRDFGRGTDDEVIGRLTALAPDDSSERIQAALVLSASGDWGRFERQLRQLELDWRDVLVAGGLADADWPARPATELPAQAVGLRRDGARTDTRPDREGPDAPARHAAHGVRRRPPADPL